jgi:hypothetical protein
MALDSTRPLYSRRLDPFPSSAFTPSVPERMRFYHMGPAITVRRLAVPRPAVRSLDGPVPDDYTSVV